MLDAEAQVHRYQILLEAARRIGSVMDLDDLVDEIIERAQDVMEAEACSLLLPDQPTGDLILLSSSDVIRSLTTAARVPAGKGVAGEVFRTRKKINLKDARRDARHYDQIDQKLGFITHAMLSIPLLDGDRCIGVMQALNPMGRDGFDSWNEQIFEAFGVLVVSALNRLDAQRREVDQARGQQELNLAREIQESFLPAPSQKFPCCRVHMKAFPAQNVGGDFYFLHTIPGHRYLMGLGDVAGKGVPAALTMARATAMIKAMIHQLDDDLSSWVSALNAQICEDLKFGRFIGMTFLFGNTSQRTLQICTAGQHSPLHFKDGKWFATECTPQPPLGILSTFTYAAETLPLKAGEYWMVFSDGITEARNALGNELTLERFKTELPTSQTGLNTFEAAIEAWRNFIGTASQHDDASVLLLDWRGAPPATEFTLDCCPETLCSARAFVESWARYAGYDYSTVGQIVLACDEASSNIFRHGYAQNPGPIQFGAELTEKVLRFVIRDQAPPVNPDQIKGRDLDDLRPGGLGTIILEKTFNTIRYEPQKSGNHLILEKELLT